MVQYDGDDWFFNENALQRVNQEYQDANVWMTYGQYVVHTSGELGHCRPLVADIVMNNAWRDCFLMPYSQLRTFYAWLFKMIKLEDLMVNSKFFPVAWDCALMFPMLEMAQYHVRFIPDILYIYNQETLLNDFKQRLNLQLATARYIKQKQRYKSLKEAPNFEKN